MKHFILLSLTCFLSFRVIAQVASPDSMMNMNTTVREKLITLAFQNPDLEVADHGVNIAEYDLKAAKGWWAENFSFSFNANEYSIKQLGKSNTTTLTPYNYGLYPLYNMGISIPIGGFFSKPQEVKADKEKVTIARAERASKYRQIKAAVLTAYENYLTSKELFTVESQLAESAYNDYLQAKEKFRDGQISVTDYNASADRYQGSLKARISAENSYNLSQIQLEELIGVPVSQVLSDTGTYRTPASQAGNHSK